MHPMRQPSPTERLERVHQLLRACRDEGHAMRKGATDPIRDAATDAYVTAVDKLVEEMAALDDIGALDELTRFAQVTWGARA